MPWRVIDTNQNYLINEHGEIFSQNSQQIIKTFPDKDGYIKTHLYSREKKAYINYFVHRLVLETFIGPAPIGRTEVHHKDGNRSNNSLDNLEWVSRKENDSHVVHKVNKGSYEPVRVQQLDLEDNLIAEFASMSEAARATGCNISKISTVCSGKRFTTGGYKWRKVESSTTIEIEREQSRIIEMEGLSNESEDIVQSL